MFIGSGGWVSGWGRRSLVGDATQIIIMSADTHVRTLFLLLLFEFCLRSFTSTIQVPVICTSFCIAYFPLYIHELYDSADQFLKYLAHVWTNSVV